MDSIIHFQHPLIGCDDIPTGYRIMFDNSFCSFDRLSEHLNLICPGVRSNNAYTDCFKAEGRYSASMLIETSRITLVITEHDWKQSNLITILNN